MELRKKKTQNVVAELVSAGELRKAKTGKGVYVPLTFRVYDAEKKEEGEIKASMWANSEEALGKKLEPLILGGAYRVLLEGDDYLKVNDIKKHQEGEPINASVPVAPEPPKEEQKGGPTLTERLDSLDKGLASMMDYCIRLRAEIANTKSGLKEAQKLRDVHAFM